MRGKLNKLTIPVVPQDTTIYVAAANQEARIESHDPWHHYKQTWQTANQIHPFITTLPCGIMTLR